MPKIRKDKGQNTPSGIPFYKQLGQHILKNPNIIDRMVKNANISHTDTVLEIGPGTGNLTVKLLQKAKKVICIEKDYRMVVELKKRVSQTKNEHKLLIIHDDFLKIDLPFFNMCIANIPYSISSRITFRLLEHRPIFKCAIIMYQKEFGEKLVAKPGDKGYGRLAANCQLLAKVYHIMKVKRNNFRPPPKVDSCVIRIEPKNPPPPVNFSEWNGMTKIIFSRKNKTLMASFKGKKLLKLMLENHKTYCAINSIKIKKKMIENDMKKMVNNILEKCDVAKKRARSLNNLTLLKLLTEFNKAHIHFSSTTS